MFLSKLIAMLWVNDSEKNCFGAPTTEEHTPYSPETIYKVFNQSVLGDWYHHILMDNYGKIVHTFESSGRWFMVNITFDVETSRYRVKTTTSGPKLTEQEERLLDFFEWYLSATITATRDIDRNSGNENRIDIYTRRNETWCMGKNTLFVTI